MLARPRLAAAMPARPASGLVAGLSRHPSGRWGLILALTLGAVAVAGPWLAPHPPNIPDYGAALRPPGPGHWLGTDATGRNQLSRLLDGARRSLGGAALVAVAITLIGLVVGTLAALGARWVDAVVMRAVDVVMALPGLILAFAVIGLLGPGYTNLLIALIAADWAYTARIARACAFEAVRSPAAIVARQIGVPEWRVILHHVLPPVFWPLLVLGTLGLGGQIAAISAFSFLGLGVQVPHAEWGAMLADSRHLFTVAPWLLLAPAACILLSVLASNLLGEALRDLATPEGRS
ncbi:ABC transporter permease [Rhodobacter calidifons]|uniref:ABC transporter permease n=1 Tax=Rhodobacter calidifons TaxID=2715277 RepID=A0ABX0GAW7_9RHOB|nr:ABC transporter permease [Rhodobacter calidifons]NHB78460.1 ABC transporter permease [Rhodobacter calidifons]